MSTENTVCTQGDIIQVLLSRKLGAVAMVRHSVLLTDTGGFPPWLNDPRFIPRGKDRNKCRQGALTQICLKVVGGDSTIGLGSKNINPIRKPKVGGFRNAWV